MHTPRNDHDQRKAPESTLKAEHDYQMHLEGMTLECPFGSMYATTCARFERMGVPAFPMAGLLVFWGGVQNGFGQRRVL